MKNFFLFLLKIIFISLLCLVTTFRCKKNTEKDVYQIVRFWSNKQIMFPSKLVFTIFGKDTINNPFRKKDFTILTYLDTIGCTSCKLQLPRWKQYVHSLDSSTNHNVNFLFFIHTDDYRGIKALLKRDNFLYPVCIDKEDSLNILNRFEPNLEFQTFLLDKDNKVVAIGNPIHNLKVKNLFERLITRKNIKNSLQQNAHNVFIDKPHINLGHIRQGEKRTTYIHIWNPSSKPLTITDIAVSCDCVDIVPEKKTIAPDDKIRLFVSYEKNNPVEFYESINIECNHNIMIPTITIEGIVD